MDIDNSEKFNLVAPNYIPIHKIAKTEVVRGTPNPGQHCFSNYQTNQSKIMLWKITK